MDTSKPITQRQQAFLDAYRVAGLVKPAAAQAGCSRELHYGALRTSETYRQAFTLVQRELVDELEEEARRRAIYGVKISILFRGKVIGYETRYSDTLLMYLLEANDPEMFEGIRQELQKEERENGFCVRWDRDEVARPSLPRMTGPQPPMPPRPPRPPVPSIRECSEPVEYAEWAAVRGMTETAPCAPPDQETLDRWARSENPGPVEWVPEEIATDLVSRDADELEETTLETDGWGTQDSDIDFCVRWEACEEEAPLPPRRGLASPQTPFRRPWPTEHRATLDHALRRACHTFSRRRSQDSNAGFCVRWPSRDGGTSDEMPRPPPACLPDGDGGRHKDGWTVPLWSASGEGRGQPLHPNNPHAHPLLPNTDPWRHSFLCATHRPTPPQSSGTLATKKEGQTLRPAPLAFHIHEKT